MTLDEGNATCGGGLCLVNHFQGMTTCPYRQDVNGNPPTGASACTLPDGGGFAQPDGGVAVGQTIDPWCADRKAASTVSCSCRCQNALGLTDDGASYCTCPTGTTCSQVVPAIDPGNPRPTPSPDACGALSESSVRALRDRARQLNEPVDVEVDPPVALDLRPLLRSRWFD